MKRSGFKSTPPRPVKTLETYTPKPRAVAVADTRARMVVPVPKADPIEHEGYRRLVAALPCIACGKWGRSQAAHGPALGKSIKCDDRTCVPLCAEELGDLGCHAKVDRYLMFGRRQRTEQLNEWGCETRAGIRADGNWPADLEPWPEDEVHQEC